MIGRSVGNYQLVSKIGEGGMGTVYLAEHRTLGRLAAVKVLRSELSSNLEIVARFHNEARVASAIRHPGIVEVYDVGTLDDQAAYIVMEFLDGESLAARIGRGAPTIGATLAILRAIARALQAAHALAIVHRDLKPENVFLVPDAELASCERVKLLDFGIAKLSPLVGETGHTRTGVVMGTPTYMAPEQCRGAGSVDHRADLYALGCIAYEMLCEEPPFLADGAGEVIARHLYFDPKPLRAHRPELSPDIEALVLQLLRKDPRARPSSAIEVVRMIDRLVASAPTMSDERRDASVVTLLPLPPEPPRSAARDALPVTLALRPLFAEASASSASSASASASSLPSNTETTLSGAASMSDESDDAANPRPPRFAPARHLIAGAAAAAVLAIAIIGALSAGHPEPLPTASLAQAAAGAPPPGNALSAVTAKPIEPATAPALPPDPMALQPPEPVKSASPAIAANPTTPPSPAHPAAPSATASPSTPSAAALTTGPTSRTPPSLAHPGVPPDPPLSRGHHGGVPPVDVCTAASFASVIYAANPAKPAVDVAIARLNRCKRKLGDEQFKELRNRLIDKY